MEPFIANIQQCKDLITEAVPLTLIYYSHIGLAVVAGFLGLFVILKDRSTAGKSLFLLAFLFAAWAVIDIFLWTGTDSRLYMYLWPVANLLEVFIFVMAFLFFFAFIKQKADFVVRAFCFVVTLPAIALVWTKHNLLFFDTGLCIPVEGWFWENYIFPLEMILTGWILVAGIYYAFKAKKGTERQITIFITLGTFLFMGSFITAGLVVDLTDFNYLYEIFAFVGTALFLWLLAYLIVRYHSFNIKVLGAQALVIALVISVVAQFLYIRNPINQVLNGISLFLVVIFGHFLIESVKKEVAARIRIEELAKELSVANERLKELDQMKSEFLSIASHQLRAPITAVQGYAANLLEGSYGVLPDYLRDPLNTIREATRLMVNSIEDYLNISRIEQGRMKYEKSEFDVADLAKKVVNELTPVAAKKNLALSINAPEDLKVTADIGKIKQVITNLVDNAIKYTNEGSVSVAVEHVDAKAKITITDTGVGIPPEEIGALFEKFKRARGANKVNTSGTGLGLYVAKQLIEGHGGAIRIESDGVGKGSRFIIELPI